MSGYWKNLEARNWVGGGSVHFSLDALPPQMRVRAILVSMDLAYTKSAADALSGTEFPRVLTSLQLGNYVTISGPDLAKLNWAIDGHVVEDPAVYNSIPGSGTSGSLLWSFAVPLRDLRSHGTDDGSLPCELLSGRNLQLTFALGSVFGVGTLAINSGTIRVAVELIHETNVPQIQRIGYTDASSATIKLEPGVYKELILVKSDGTAVTAAEVTSLDITADGRPIITNMRHEQLVYNWNRTAARNGFTTGRGELSRTAPAFLPLIWTDNSGKANITKQTLVEKDLLIQITAGSLTNARLVYWKAVAKDTAAIAQIARVIGAPVTATTYEPAVASKTPAHAAKAGEAPSKKVTTMYQVLPGKFRDEPTPGNKMA